MKNSIFLWACLAILNATTLHATDTDSTSVNSNKGELSPEKPNTETADSKKDLIVFIPNRTLDVEVIANKNILRVNLSGYDGEVLDWMIFKPKAKVKSRISTKDKIDEIKITNLESGEYVLMVKDMEGRILYQSFNKA